MLKLDSGGEIRPGDSIRDVAAAIGAITHGVHSGPGGERLTIPSVQIGGVWFHCVLRLDDGRVSSAELLAGESQLPSREWSRENELARKRIHESWAAKVLGRELVVRPVELEAENPGDPPMRITPAFTGPETPMHAECAWGEVLSVLDEKACQASLIIRWNVRPGQPDA